MLHMVLRNDEITLYDDKLKKKNKILSISRSLGYPWELMKQKDDQ